MVHWVGLEPEAREHLAFRHIASHSTEALRVKNIRLRRLGATVFLMAYSVCHVAHAQQQTPVESQSAAKQMAAPASATPQAVESAVVGSQSSVLPVPAAQPVVPVSNIVVPAGTHLPLLLHNGVSTRSARPGDPVYLETLFPVIVDKKVVIPAGSYVSGEITDAKRPGRVSGRGELGIKLDTMILPNSYVVDLNAQPGSASTGGGESVDSEGKVKGDTDKASDAGTMIKTTAAGAGIGAIAAGAKGAGIGAGVGAAGGLMTVLLSRGPEAELPRGSTIDAVLNRPLVLDTSKVQFNGPGQASSLAGPPSREPVRSTVPF
jgi:hypothetical protein